MLGSLGAPVASASFRAGPLSPAAAARAPAGSLLSGSVPGSTLPSSACPSSLQLVGCLRVRQLLPQCQRPRWPPSAPFGTWPPLALNSALSAPLSAVWTLPPGGLPSCCACGDGLAPRSRREVSPPVRGKGNGAGPPDTLTSCPVQLVEMNFFPSEKCRLVATKTVHRSRSVFYWHSRFDHFVGQRGELRNVELS